MGGHPPADLGPSVKAGSGKFGEISINADNIAASGILRVYGISRSRKSTNMLEQLGMHGVLPRLRGGK